MAVSQSIGYAYYEAAVQDSGCHRFGHTWPAYTHAGQGEHVKQGCWLLLALDTHQGPYKAGSQFFEFLRTWSNPNRFE
jgi:hypothetical protein